MKQCRLVVVVILVLLVGGIVAAEENPRLTVGEFAVGLAKMITLKTEVAPEQAVAFLGQLGVALPVGLDSPVSEADFVDAFNEIGLQLTTSNPDRVVTDANAGRVFRMFDRNESLFSSELFKLCKGGAENQNRPCITDGDCVGGFCQVLQSIRCQEGANDGGLCMSDADCPDGTCNIPPGQRRKLDIASPNGDD